MRYTFSWKYEKTVMPDELLEVVFSFDRDVRKIWALELPVEEISINELIWHLNMPFFWQDNKPFSLNPIEVINNPEYYPIQINKIISVDTKYPIDIIWWKSKWVILDGLHRLCKLYVKGEKTIKVRKLNSDHIKLIEPDELIR